jgi:TM2 domain-containing membrane protein YozV
MKKTASGIEEMLWSIGLPGFGQFLNKKYFKGTILILLEIIINIKARINTIQVKRVSFIRFSFARDYIAF